MCETLRFARKLRQLVESVEVIELVESVELVELVELVESVEVVELVESAEVVELVDSVEPVIFFVWPTCVCVWTLLLASSTARVRRRASST